MKFGNNNRLCLVATFFPPIGGVTTYNERLLGYLKKIKYDIVPLDIRKSGKIKIIKALIRHEIFYISMSNLMAMTLLVIFLKILNKTIILSVHQQFPLSGAISEKLFESVLPFCHTCIVENKESLSHLSKRRINLLLNSAFIPPIIDSSLLDSSELTDTFRLLRKKYKKIFCTNAYNYVLDAQNNELYAISDLIRIFSELDDICLVVADPSSYNYKNIKEEINIPSNVLFLHNVPSFIEVLKKSDCFIRATSTDGDSVSVRESLWLGIPTIATDVVTRPEHCLIFKYGEWEHLKRLIIEVLNDKYAVSSTDNNSINALEKLVPIFNQLNIVPMEA